MPEFADVGTALLDFDDTLAVGPITWGMEQFLPDVMARHGITPDKEQLDAALIAAQEMSAAAFDDNQVLAEFLAHMDWPQEMWADLEVGFQFEFAFSLFDDTLPFLQHLRERGVRAFVVSNNNRSPELAAQLGIADHVAGFITPSMRESLRPKPHPSMFDAVRALLPGLDPASTVLIGDDPWSDAAFAAACGLPCLLVDRHKRYRRLSLPGQVTFADSLKALTSTFTYSTDQPSQQAVAERAATPSQPAAAHPVMQAEAPSEPVAAQQAAAPRRRFRFWRKRRA
jgi:FMN phosphatase YigB (HAD superfamily)